MESARWSGPTASSPRASGMATLCEVAATSTSAAFTSRPCTFTCTVCDAPVVKHSSTIIMEAVSEYTAVCHTLCITYWNWGIICAQAYRSPGCSIHSEAYH